MIADEIKKRFDGLRLARYEVLEMTAHHIPALNQFHSGEDFNLIGKKAVKLGAFANLMPDTADLDALRKNESISIASTVTCVKSLLSCPKFRPDKNADYQDILTRIDRKRQARHLSTRGLKHGNAFTVGLLLPMLKSMRASKTDALVQASIRYATKAISKGGAFIPPFPPSGYLTYWNLVGLQVWDVDLSTLGVAAIAWSRSELYRQIALFESGTDEDSDVYQLGYNLLIQKRFSREHLHDAVLQKGLEVLFAAQLDHGIWEKKAPLFVYKTYGDAYCFCFEMLNSLLSEFMSEVSLLVEYQKKLDTAFRWLVRNKDKSQEVPVWRSGHRHDDVRAESWATAEVYLFLQQYSRLLSDWMQNAVLESFRSRRGGIPNPKAFSEFYDPVVQLPKEGHAPVKLSVLLKERLCDPLKVTLHGSDVFSLSENPDAKTRVRSGVLFGPPGTGKTSYVRAIASYLGWPLVILDPSDFAGEGLHLIASTTSRVFEVLLELENTVIFFDEMEEMLRKREPGGGSTFEQRFLTTSLLPKLQYLADKAQSVFFVATNHFTDMDDAAKRDGRFDFRIQVLPPCFDEKIRMLNEAWMPDTLAADVLRELERDEVKVKIEWATRTEMLGLVSALKGKSVVDASHILNTFKQTIEIESYEKDKEHNFFSKV